MATAENDGRRAEAARIERLVARETAALRAVMATLTDDEYRRVITALRAAAAPLPGGDDPFSLSDAEKLAFADALDALGGAAEKALFDATERATGLEPLGFARVRMPAADLSSATAAS